MEQDLFVWLNWKRWFFSLSPNGQGIGEEWDFMALRSMIAQKFN